MKPQKKKEYFKKINMNTDFLDYSMLLICLKSVLLVNSMQYLYKKMILLAAKNLSTSKIQNNKN